MAKHPPRAQGFLSVLSDPGPHWLAPSDYLNEVEDPETLTLGFPNSQTAKMTSLTSTFSGRPCTICPHLSCSLLTFIDLGHWAFAMPSTQQTYPCLRAFASPWISLLPCICMCHFLTFFRCLQIFYLSLSFI